MPDPRGPGPRGGNVFPICTTADPFGAGHFVYRLWWPGEERIYIGYTWHPYQRLWAHSGAGKSHPVGKVNREHGLRPRMEVVAHFDTEAEARAEERRLIKEHAPSGLLLNRDLCEGPKDRPSGAKAHVLDFHAELL